MKNASSVKLIAPLLPDGEAQAHARSRTAMGVEVAARGIASVGEPRLHLCRAINPQFAVDGQAFG